MSLIVRTEVWHTAQGEVAKAVVRTDKGTLVGATNQTAPVALTLIGKR